MRSLCLVALVGVLSAFQPISQRVQTQTTCVQVLVPSSRVSGRRFASIQVETTTDEQPKPETVKRTVLVQRLHALVPRVRQWMIRFVHLVAQRKAATQQAWQKNSDAMVQRAQQSTSHYLALLRASTTDTNNNNNNNNSADIPTALAKASLVATRKRVQDILDFAKASSHSRLFSSSSVVVSTVSSAVARNPVTNAFRNDADYYAKARKQPKNPQEEARLQAKYAAIESLEERAFTILVDLGMVQINNA